MRRQVFASLIASGAAMLAVNAASAGGFIAPVVDTAVVAPVPVVEAPASDWAGAYGGVSLGYSFGGDDEVGLEYFSGGAATGRDTGLANLDIGGVTGALQAGYRWQRGAWVFGPELAIEGGSVDDSVSFTSRGVDYTAESSVNYIATLALKTGYIVNPQTLVYGTAGLAYGDFTYDLNDATPASEDYNANGWMLGLGVERKLSDRMSVFAEYQYRDFGSEDVTFPDGSDSTLTVATPSHQNVRLGVNFSF